MMWSKPGKIYLQYFCMNVLSLTKQTSNASHWSTAAQSHTQCPPENILLHILKFLVFQLFQCVPYILRNMNLFEFFKNHTPLKIQNINTHFEQCAKNSDVLSKHLTTVHGEMQNGLYLRKLSILVAQCCNPAIGGQGHSGFTWIVRNKSSSQPWISVRIKPKDVDTPSQPGLVNSHCLSVRWAKQSLIAMTVLFCQDHWCRCLFQAGGQLKVCKLVRDQKISCLPHSLLTTIPQSVYVSHDTIRKMIRRSLYVCILLTKTTGLYQPITLFCAYCNNWYCSENKSRC